MAAPPGRSSRDAEKNGPSDLKSAHRTGERQLRRAGQMGGAASRIAKNLRSGESPLPVLSGQVLPLLRPAHRDPHRVERLRVHPLVLAAPAGGGVHRGRRLVPAGLQPVQAPPRGQPLRDLRRPPADLPRLHAPRTASTKTTGSTTSTSRPRSRSKSMPRPCCGSPARARDSQSEAADSPFSSGIRKCSAALRDAWLAGNAKT